MCWFSAPVAASVKQGYHVPHVVFIQAYIRQTRTFGRDGRGTVCLIHPTSQCVTGMFNVGNRMVENRCHDISKDVGMAQKQQNADEVTLSK